MNLVQTIFVNLLRKTADKIESGECGLKDNEMIEISKFIAHQEITEEQVCQLKNISRATLSRKIASGVFPKPHKEAGDKKYFWKDEIIFL